MPGIAPREPFPTLSARCWVWRCSSLSLERPRERMAVAVIVAAAIAITAWRDLSGVSLNTRLSIALAALIALFNWAAVWVILRDLFRKRAVGAENVFGAICGYLIAGDAWAAVHGTCTLRCRRPTSSIRRSASSCRLARSLRRVFVLRLHSNAHARLRGRDEVRPPATTLGLLCALFGLFSTAVVVSQISRPGAKGKAVAGRPTRAPMIEIRGAEIPRAVRSRTPPDICARPSSPTRSLTGEYHETFQ